MSVTQSITDNAANALIDGSGNALIRIIVQPVPFPPAPTILSVNPGSGLTTGGTPVTITGSDFIAPAFVTFGGLFATSVSVVNSTTITCNTPADSAGIVNVAVGTSAGTGIGFGLYTYVSAPPAPQPVTSIVFNYIFQFASELQARTDSIVGPYLNLTTGNLLDLWVYDLLVTKTTLPGYWVAIGRTVDAPDLDASPFLKLVFHYNGSGGPTSLIVNNLDPRIGENFTIIAGQAGQVFINDWAARNL